MADDWGQFIDKVQSEGKPRPQGQPPREGKPRPQGQPPREGKPRPPGQPPRGKPRPKSGQQPAADPHQAAPRPGKAAQARPPGDPHTRDATQRIRQEIDQKARIIPVEKIQQGGSKFVRVINPSTLSEIVGKAVIGVLEERGGTVGQAERAEIESQARKQFMDLLGEHQRVLAEKQQADAERAKLEAARQRAEAEKEEATKQREQIERERARALAEADKRRAELEQDRLKALAEAREQREELERAREHAAAERQAFEREAAAERQAFEREAAAEREALEREAAAKREALERERAEALAGKSQAEAQKGALAEQMESLRAEIEASRQALAAEREAEAEAGPATLKLDPESVADVEYRVQGLLSRMLRDGELAAGRKAGDHAGVEDFKRELGETVGRVLSAAQKDAGGGRSEAIELLERRIAKLNRALVERQEAMDGLDAGQDVHLRFRDHSMARTRTDQASHMASALVGAGIELPASYDLPDDDEGLIAISDVDELPAEEDDTPPPPPRPAYVPAEFLSPEEPGLSRLVPPGSWPFLWRCGTLRMVFLDNLEVRGIAPEPEEISGPFPASSRLFGGGKVTGVDDLATWDWPLHGS